MLERGIVALTFLISSDRNAFPGSQLNSLSSPSSTSPIIPEQYHQSIHQQTIRNQVHPPPFLHPISNNHPETTGSTGSNDASSASSSGSLPFEYCMSTASEADFLRAQNQKLLGDVRNLTSEIECLRRENQKQNFSKRLDNAYRNYGGYLSGDSENNSSNHGIRDFTSCRAFPNMLRNYYDDNFQMQKRTPRDTLL
uniref:Uncharacterized protein n=1 Tax=Meloidogyne hapla TaxID=6305 RepID=A0A1I8BT81_MELHA